MLWLLCPTSGRFSEPNLKPRPHPNPYTLWPRLLHFSAQRLGSGKAAEEAKAKERQIEAGERGKEGGRGNVKPLAKDSPREKRAPRTSDKVGAFAGYSGRTIENLALSEGKVFKLG